MHLALGLCKKKERKEKKRKEASFIFYQRPRARSIKDEQLNNL